MRISYITLLLLSLSLSLTAQKNTRQDYIRKYYKIAISEMQSYGIPASITMAQGILESNNGNGYLATEANNHFGIKCHDWTGPSVHKDDDAKDECFRKYFETEDSYKDHSLFLTTRSRYAFLFDLKEDDYKGWAKGLKKAGYATDPHYPAKLIKIIEDNELFLLDEFALSSNPEKVNLPVMIPQNDNTIIEAAPVVDKTVVKPIIDKIHTSPNGLHYLVIQNEITYKAIAENHHLHLWEVYKFNDLEKEAKAPELGQRIYLQRKRSKVKKGALTHTVIPGETMYEIAQKYGIRLKSLYKINNMNNGTQVQVGEAIKLNKKALIK